MSKKGGTIVKIVAVVAGIAAIGTACYVYKDKIKEFFEKLNLKDKLDSAKSFVDENLLGNKPEEDYFDDADFFADDTDSISDSETANRGYTSITITAEDSAEADEAEDSSEAEDVSSEEYNDTDTYENEGLSDTAEDEDALAEEAALDGVSLEEI